MQRDNIAETLPGITDIIPILHSNKTTSIFTNDGQFAREENDSIQCSVKFDSIFPITTLHDTMPLYKYLKFSQFKHTIKHYDVMMLEQSTGRGVRAARWHKTRKSINPKP